MFRALTEAEMIEFRQWARANHVPGDRINPKWHEVCRLECEKINRQHAKTTNFRALRA